jgi:uncharacterized protein
MTKDILRYDRMVETALRSVVRDALSHAARHGLPGSHHFYITFRTGDAGVELPDFLRARFPQEMTIVLEHQFWDLSVTDEAFAVTLSFQNRPERLTIPLAAISAFADPSVKFGLQFQDGASSAPASVDKAAPPDDKKAAPPAKAPPALAIVESKSEDAGRKSGKKKPGEVVTLDTFRKK